MGDIPGLGEVEKVAIGEIRPAPDNPRRIGEAAVEAVAKSLERFGWQQPIVVDNEGEIIVGHTRYAAAKSLGAETVPVVRAAELTQEEVKAYRIADNRSGEYSRWEYDALAKQLGSLSDDLSDALGVANWSAVMVGLEIAQAEAGELLGLKESTEARLKVSVEYAITFDSQADADKVLAMLAEASGTCDIRAKR